MRDADGSAPALPVGVVTLLLTDVEASTALWRATSDAARLMARQGEIIGASVARHGGVRPLEQGEGDSVVAAFASAGAALAAAVDAQRELAAEPWPAGRQVRVRMALATGEVQLRDARNYGGTAIIRGARLRDLARGGQVLLSAATAELVRDNLPPGASLVDLGTTALKGFDRAERVYQLGHPDLAAEVGTVRRGSALPVWPTPLVGRERERAELTDLVGSNRLVTITGVGGTGKTRLAHALAGELRDRWADGVVWVELARLADGAHITGAVLAACGVPEVPGASALEVLLHHLSAAEKLLVLDNCEHLVEAAAGLVDAVVRQTSGVAVLVTSREPLGVAGEVVWRAPSLALPPEDERDAGRLADADAVRLFVARARATRPDFALDAMTTIAHVCRRLDGMPLAIELAAARIRTLSLDRLAAGLDDRFRLLTGGARTAVARQRTLVASIEWSHDLLDDTERMLFRRLAVFAAPCTIDAAEAVAADDELDRLEVFDVLARLVDKSLVQHAGDRYGMLETLREYARERAEEAGELAALRDRHLAWFRRRAGDWALDRQIARQGVLDEVERENPDLVAALDWSLGTPGPRAVELLHPLMALRQGREMVGDVPAIARRVLDGLSTRSGPWLEALAPMALPLFYAGEVAWIPDARAGLDASGGSLDPTVRGLLEQGIALPSAFFDRPEGLAGLRRAVETGHAAGLPRVEIEAATTLAFVLVEAGNLPAGRPLLAWVDRQVPRDSALRFIVDMSLCLEAWYSGELRQARAHVERYLPESPLIVIAYCAAFLGLYEGDADLVRKALAMMDRKPMLGAFQALGYQMRAIPSLLGGDYAGARRELEQAGDLWSFGNTKLWWSIVLGEVLLSEGDVDAASRALDRIRPHLAGSALYVMAAASVINGYIARARGARGDAESAAHDALERAAEYGLTLIATNALELLAVLAVEADDAARAGRLLGAAATFREHTGYTWNYRHQRAAVDAVRSSLAPAHLAEGARLSLDDAIAYARRGRGERGRPTHGWESLTPSEARVVECVAAGLANRAIATKLFVSVATVKTHLVHVYAKLDVRTRAELAGAAARRDLAGV